MASLNIDRVKRFVATYEELQKLAAELYPDHEVQIVPRPSRLDPSVSVPELPRQFARLHTDRFNALSGVKQVAYVMGQYGRPIEKQALIAELQRRGSKVGPDTLTSYLSREPIFESVSRGVWKLNENGGQEDWQDVK